MNLNAIRDFVTREHPRFLCEADGGQTYVAQLEHRITAPTESDLDAIPAPQAQLKALYSQFGSLRLYCDTRSTSCAFYLAKPSEWSQLKQEFMGWIKMLGTDDRHQLPDWIESCITFGEIPETGNYLLLPTEGNDSGKVYLFEHDGFVFQEEARDLASFMDSVTTPNESLFEKIRANTCYSDGETATQWLVAGYEDG